MTDTSASLTTPSPFLPGTTLQYAWDSTSLGWFTECARKYQYLMLDGWQSRGLSHHLLFGQIYHSALETFDHQTASGASRDDALRAAVRYALMEAWNGGEVWGDEKKNTKTLLRTIIWYVDHFGANDAVETITLPDGRPALEVSFRFEPGPSFTVANVPIILCGHLDRIVSFNDVPSILDRKTTGGPLNQRFFDSFNPHIQMSLYPYAGQKLFNLPIASVIIDAAQVMPDFSDFQRGTTYRSPANLLEFEMNLKETLDRAERYAATGYYPQNPTACVAGDTLVTMRRNDNRQKVSISYLYKQFHGIEVGNRWKAETPTELLSDIGGHVGFQKVTNVFPTGKKPVFRLRTKHSSIKATADHRFKTPQGWQRLDELSKGDLVCCWKSAAEKKAVSKVSEKRHRIASIRFHPYGNKQMSRGQNYKTLRTARLVVEAQMNELTLPEFVRILRKDPVRAGKLLYLRSNLEIHHKNGDPSDDRLINLQVLTPKAHRQEHLKDLVHASNKTHWEEITQIEVAGAELTYDISMEAPNHNFVANKFIVHNCHNYGGCPFRSICLLSPESRPNFLSANFDHRPWNPLIERN